MITETFAIIATDTDILAAPSRLQSIPYAGTLVLEVTATPATATNNMALTVEMPDGSTPVNSQIVPAGLTAGSLNTEDKWQMSFAAAQGSHFTVGMVETGACTAVLRATLVP